MKLLDRFLMTLIPDSVWGRLATRRYVHYLLRRAHEVPKNPQIFDEIRNAALGGRRFVRCCLLEQLSEVESLWLTAFPLLMEGLASPDGFVRHSAASGLARLSWCLMDSRVMALFVESRPKLITLERTFQDEGVGFLIRAILRDLQKYEAESCSGPKA